MADQDKVETGQITTDAPDVTVISFILQKKNSNISIIVYSLYKIVNYPRKLCRSAWAGWSAWAECSSLSAFLSICLFVCLFVRSIA